MMAASNPVSSPLRWGLNHEQEQNVDLFNGLCRAQARGRHTDWQKDHASSL